MKAQLQALIQEHTRALNRICMAAELMDERTDGPRPIMISTIGGGMISYPAGENQRHVPALLEHFGSDGWHLYQLARAPYLFKVTVMGLGIEIQHVDTESDLMPDCCRIPLVDQAVS
jgi:hypothetical protein